MSRVVFMWASLSDMGTHIKFLSSWLKVRRCQPARKIDKPASVACEPDQYVAVPIGVQGRHRFTSEAGTIRSDEARGTGEVGAGILLNISIS